MSVLRFFSFSSFFHHWDPLSAMPTPLSCWSAEGFPCFTCTECIDTGASGSAWAGDKTSPRGARKVYRKDHSGKYETRLLGETRDPAACTSRCAPRLSGTWEPQSNSWAFFTGSMWRIWKLGRHKLKPILQLWVWFLWLLETSFALPCVLPMLWGGHGTGRGNQAVYGLFPARQPSQEMSARGSWGRDVKHCPGSYISPISSPWAREEYIWSPGAWFGSVPFSDPC